MHLSMLGHAVIVNNVEWEVNGTEKDVEALRKTYETIGFQVQVKTNCTGKVNCFSKLQKYEYTNKNVHFSPSRVVLLYGQKSGCSEIEKEDLVFFPANVFMQSISVSMKYGIQLIVRESEFVRP